jgi:D-cysteine desulfhydrase/L-cysteate sulfo-lyase
MAPVNPPLFSFDQFRQIVSKVPRVELACIPTPLQEARVLSRRLGGPRIFLKRDDLTGVAFGGNKTRNLEFRLARTMSEKADVVIVGLDLQSNSARQTVGSCNKLGMKTVLVLEGEPPPHVQGNLLVDYLLGAEVHFAQDRAAQRAKLDALAEAVRRQGKVPHILNDNPMFDVASAIAYIECTMEIVEQMHALGTQPGCLYLSSSGKGQAGLVLARRLFGLALDVHCVTATREFDVAERTAEIANRTAQFLDLDVRIQPEEIENDDEYVGEAYGIPSEAGNAAVRLFAETEGVILDPVYTGKAAAGMVDHIQAGQFKPEDSVVFIHTGGTPAVFTHNHLWLPG